MVSKRGLLAGLVLVWAAAGCSGNPVVGAVDGGTDGGGTDGGGTDGGSSPLIGIWDLTTTPSGSAPTQSVVTIGTDQLTVTAPDFTWTLVRSGNVLQGQDVSGNTIDVNSTQSAGAFNSGIIPFNLGGTWSIQGGNAGVNPTTTCSLQVSAGQINASCAGDFDFEFTTTSLQAGSSSFGDFGGTWNNVWTWTPDAGTYTCGLDFAGSSISTCDGGGHILEDITFQLNGTMASGNAQGTEFSATRR